MVEYRQIISKNEINDRVRELAGEISKDYDSTVPLFISLLKGAFIFSADLVRNISIQHEIDFITLYSYENGARRENDVKMLNHLRADLEGRDIILIDEIVDTGHTLARLIKTLEQQPINSLKICTLLDKPSARKAKVPVHYSGFTIPDVFVVGYGLDFMERYRNLPFIAELTSDPSAGGPAPSGLVNR